MKRPSIQSVLTRPVSIALAVAVLFSIRFLDCLPFSQSTRLFNYETVSTLTSFLIYAAESFSFPLGAIKGLTFPFQDANVGNVGAIPLFAVSFKAVGQLVPYFLTFDYFVLAEILSALLTAFFAQKILLQLGVQHVAFRALGALLTGTSFILLTRSAWPQTFCVVAFPLFSAWLYAMLLLLQSGNWKLKRDVTMIALFPIAALVDNYALFGIMLGVGVLLLRELFEAVFGGLPTSWNRCARLLLLLVGGTALSLLGLYLIGMFPLPPVPNTFTSYDFGIGGRYHTADLFAPWVPAGTKYFPEPSLLGRLGLPFSADNLAEGQYEGIAYVGTPVLLLWIGIAAAWLLSMARRTTKKIPRKAPIDVRVVLYSPWKKVGWGVLAVFIFSLGYELHILGETFPNFSGMPAAWIADRLPAAYNIRATGRLASLLSLFLILEGVRVLYVWYAGQSASVAPAAPSRFRYVGLGIVVALAVLHVVEVAPLLRPVPTQPARPIGGVFSEADIDTLRRVGTGHDLVLIAPSVRAVEMRWTAEAFSLAYYLGLRSNLYYIARTHPNHDMHITNDLSRILGGDWDGLTKDYGRALIAMPSVDAAKLRTRMRAHFEETRVGNVSLWARRDSKN